jgi:hypothetical protein
MSDEHVKPINVAILGTDALLAARPVDPIQLTRACLTAGFDFVAPVTWGEELIASRLGERAAGAGSAAVVSASCPFVSEQLRSAPVKRPVLRTVPPPVACARYLRAVFHPHLVYVTYVGACPGAVDPKWTGSTSRTLFLRGYCGPASTRPWSRVISKGGCLWSALAMPPRRAEHRPLTGCTSAPGRD